MSRPGGNPELKKHSFTTDRDEPLVEKLTLRITKSMKEEIKSIDGWQDWVREAIAKRLKHRKDESKQASSASEEWRGEG